MLFRSWCDERGNVAILFALLFPVIAVAIGAAADYSGLALERTELQKMADSAAIAGARDMMDNSALPPSQLATYAQNTAIAFIQSQAPESTRTVQVSISGYNGGTESSVLVSLSYSKPLTFTGWLGVAPSMLVEAKAKAVPGSTPMGACVIALDPSANKSFVVSGNGTVNVPNCGIYVNSSARNALSQMGASWLKAKSINVVGNYGGNNYSPAPKTAQPAIADPLASVPEPTAAGGCNYTNWTFNAPTTLPGGTVYCGTISFNANVTFGQGIHYFKFATVSTGSNISITGSGVMLYFDRNSTLSSSTTGQVNLTPPQSGTYAGIVIFGSRSAALPTFKLAGGSNYLVGGTIYLPSAALQLYGSADVAVTAEQGYVIAQQFTYQGDSDLTVDSFGGAEPAALSPQPVALVQ